MGSLVSGLLGGRMLGGMFKGGGSNSDSPGVEMTGAGDYSNSNAANIDTVSGSASAGGNTRGGFLGTGFDLAGALKSGLASSTGKGADATSAMGTQSNALFSIKRMLSGAINSATGAWAKSNRLALQNQIVGNDPAGERGI